MGARHIPLLHLSLLEGLFVWGWLELTDFNVNFRFVYVFNTHSSLCSWIPAPFDGIQQNGTSRFCGGRTNKVAWGANWAIHASYKPSQANSKETNQASARCTDICWGVNESCNVPCCMCTSGVVMLYSRLARMSKISKMTVNSNVPLNQWAATSCGLKFRAD